MGSFRTERYRKLVRAMGRTRQARRSLTSKLSCRNAARGRSCTTFRVFFDHFLEHGLVQGKIGHQALELPVLLLEKPELTKLRRPQAAVLPLPAIESLLRDPELANYFLDLRSGLRLLQREGDLLLCELRFLHGPSPLTRVEGGQILTF
jgi:hypothetical protein